MAAELLRTVASCLNTGTRPALLLVIEKQEEAALSAPSLAFCGSTVVCMPTRRTLMEKRRTGLTKFATTLPLTDEPARTHCRNC